MQEERHRRTRPQEKAGGTATRSHRQDQEQQAHALRAYPLRIHRLNEIVADDESSTKERLGIFHLVSVSICITQQSALSYWN